MKIAKKLRFIAIFLSLLLVFYAIPANSLKIIASELLSIEMLSSNADTEISPETSEQTGNDGSQTEAEGGSTEVYVLGEDISKREKNTKHFRMSDGSFVAVQYAEPVHYLDNGVYAEYDNTLTLSSFSANGNVSTTDMNDIAGYTASKNNVSVKFSNSLAQNSLISLSKDGYGVSIIPTVINFNATVSVANPTSKPPSDGKLTLEEASKLATHTSSVKYSGMFSGADLEYVLSGSKLKENIIINSPSTTYVYTFYLDLIGLYAVLNSDGSIYLYGNDTDTIEFVIPAGYMYDAAGKYSKSVAYSLRAAATGKYILTVTADAEWINGGDVTFPVTVDPTIASCNNEYTRESIKISNSTLTTENGSMLGKSGNEEYYQLIKFTSLPTIPSTSRVYEGTVQLSVGEKRDCVVGAYQVLSDWSGFTNVSNFNSGIGDVAFSYVDYSITSYGVFNITQLVKEWYSNTDNHGICFKRIDGAGIVSCALGDNYPQLTIKYIDMKGLEDYWSYSSWGVGASGVANVNLAEGNLILSFDTVSTTDYIMPYMPVLTYDSNLAGKYFNFNNANIPYRSSNAGYGLKWSMDESVVERQVNSGDSLITYYVFCDGDGTEHYFKYDSKTKKIIDEDGLGLEMTVDTSKYVITYPDMSNKTFDIKAETDYIKAGGVLTSVTDRYGNRTTFSVSDSGKVTSISVVPNGSSEVTTLNITYNSSNLVNRILNPDTQKAVMFYYSSTTSGTASAYSGGYIRKIVYAHQTGSTNNSNWNSYMSSGSNQYITVDQMYTFSYSGSYINLVSDITEEKVYEFSMVNGKVIAINEMPGLDFYYGGRQRYFEYGAGYAKVKNPGADDLAYTDDDIISVYTLDDSGRLKNVFSKKADESEVFGGAGYVYENESEDYGDISSVKNNVKNSSLSGGNDANYITNGGFDYNFVNGDNFWIYSNAVVSSLVSGDRKALIEKDSTEDAYISQRVTLAEGAYSLTFDAMVGYNDSTATIYSTLRVQVIDSDGWILLNEILPLSTESVTECATFTVSDNDTVNVKIIAENDDYATKPEKVYVDNIMLSANSSSATYSLVQNGTFEDNVYSTTGALQTEAIMWNFSAKESYTEADSYSYVESEECFGRSVKINGSLRSEKSVYQTVYSNSNGIQADQIKISGYAKSMNFVYGSGSAFRIRVEIQYESSPSNAWEAYDVDFEPTLKEEWQFASQIYNIASEERIVCINVRCEYSYQESSAYFDNISVSLVPRSEQKENYYYTDEKNAYYGLLKATKTGNTTTYYEYDDYKKVVKEVIIKGTTGEIYEYNYVTGTEETYSPTLDWMIVYKFSGVYWWNLEDASADPEADITKTVVSKTEYTTNAYGLVTKIKTYEAVSTSSGITKKSGTLPIITQNTYKTTSGSNVFGALMSTTDTLGKITRYYYDETYGYLLAEINPDGTGMSYGYDGMGRLVRVVPAKYTSSTDTYTEVANSESVEYTYNSAGQIQYIESESTKYVFTYDAMGQLSAILPGEYYTLAEYTYNRYKGKVSNIRYGNGDKVEYVYDSLDRVSEMRYIESDGTVSASYEYQYSNEGNLSRFKNITEGTQNVYTYDELGRLTRVVECAIDDSKSYVDLRTTYNSVGYVSLDRVIVPYSKGSTELKYYGSVGYSYDDVGRLTDATIYTNNCDGEITITYDGLDRVTTRTVEFKKQTTGTTVFNHTVNYGYETNASGTQTSTRMSTYTSELNGTSTTYTVKYDESGYITEIYRNGSIFYDYEYDDQGQLTIFYDGITIYSYSYDDAGNILYRNEDRDLVLDEYTYTYGDSNWGDLLTAYNGNAITYDAMGNPLQYYNGNVFTWEQGRRLSTISNNGTEIATYKYNDEGIRTSKTTQWSNYTYILNGSQIIGETWDDCINIYLYDENGSPVGFQYRYENMASDTFHTYFYEKNVFGDIIAIYDANGVKQVSYSYDAFGNSTETVHVSTTRAKYNNLRYRGYYYDKETGFYLTGTRYYDPEIGRFINADSVIAGVGGSIQGYNMFAYCFNNPVNMSDPSGNWPKWIETAANWVNKNIIQPVANFFSPSTNTISGQFQDGILRGSGSLTGGYSEINGRLQVNSKDSKNNGMLGGFAKVSTGNASGKIGIGNNNAALSLKGVGDGLTATAQAGIQYKNGAGLAAKAKAAVLSGRATAELELFGWQIEFGVSGDLLSVGAEAMIGVFPNEGFTAKASVGAGLFGAGFVFRVKPAQ